MAAPESVSIFRKSLRVEAPGWIDVTVEELSDGGVRISVEYRRGEPDQPDEAADLEGPSVEELAFESGGLLL